MVNTEPRQLEQWSNPHRGRRRDLIGGGVLLVLLIAPFLRLIWLGATSKEASLPDTGWTPLVQVLIRSVAMAGVAGVIASLGGLLLVMAVRVSARPWPLLALAGWVLATPSVVLAVPLSRAVGFNPMMLSAVTYGVAGIPIAGLLVAGSLAKVSLRQLSAAADLGTSPALVWRRLLLPACLPGLGLGWAVSALLALTDPSVPLALTNSRPMLATFILHAVTVDAPAAVAVRAVLALVMLASVAALLSARWLGTLSLPVLHGSSELARFLDPWRVVRSAGAVVGVGFAALLAATIVQAAQWQQETDTLWITAMITLLTAALVVFLSLLVGGATALFARHRGWCIDAIMLAVLALSPVALGAVIAVNHRVPLPLGPVAVPALVGGAAPLHGMVGVVLCLMTLGVPAAYLMVVVGLRKTVRFAEAAELLGAGRIRVTSEVFWPTLRPALGGTLVILTCVVLTRVTPVVFVQPPELSLAAPRIVTLVGAGKLSEASVLSLAMTVLTAAVGFTVVVLGRRRRT